jgi:CRISPR/Cas system-associated exonuclease Cas4 (RecB family)
LIEGIIDLIYQLNDETSIIDFKSTMDNDVNDQVYNFQLKLYMHGYHQATNNIVKNSYVLNIASDEQSEEVVGDVKDIDNVNDRILDLFKNLKNHQFKKNYHHCQHCKYQAVCSKTKECD